MAKWLKEWSRCWFSCSCVEFTKLFLLRQLHIFFIKHIWLSLFCATPVAWDEVLSPPSTVLSTTRGGSRSLLTWGPFAVQRIWDAFLVEERAWLHPLIQDLYPVFVPAPCPSSGFYKDLAFWWPLLTSLQGWSASWLSLVKWAPSRLDWIRQDFFGKNSVTSRDKMMDVKATTDLNY